MLKTFIFRSTSVDVSDIVDVTLNCVIGLNPDSVLQQSFSVCSKMSLPRISLDGPFLTDPAGCKEFVFWNTCPPPLFFLEEPVRKGEKVVPLPASRLNFINSKLNSFSFYTLINEIVLAESSKSDTDY